MNDACLTFCSAPGIFSLLEMLDFGLLRTTDDPAVLRLNIINSGIKPIQIVVSFVFVDKTQHCANIISVMHDFVDDTVEQHEIFLLFWFISTKFNDSYSNSKKKQQFWYVR